MPFQLYVLLAGILFGIGLGSAFYRRNLIAILLGFITAAGGIMVVMAALVARKGASVEGSLFLITFMGIQTMLLLIGCVVVFRRYLAAGYTNVEQGNQLKN